MEVTALQIATCTDPTNPKRVDLKIQQPDGSWYFMDRQEADNFFDAMQEAMKMMNETYEVVKLMKQAVAHNTVIEKTLLIPTI